MDFRNAKDWIRGFQSIEFLTPGPLVLGSKLKETRTLLGRTESQVIEIVELDRPRLYAVKSHATGVAVTFTYQFSEAGPDATVVDLTVEVTPMTLLARTFVPIAIAAIKKFDGDQLELLREAIERRSQTA